MNKRLVNYFNKVYRETGVTIMLQEALYNKYGYIIKKMRNRNEIE